MDAVKNVNLVIYEGEMIGLIGQNGAGKTTLAKHFNSLLKPTSGFVYVDGKDTRTQTVAELSKIVGYAFQNPDSMIFSNTVIEELEFGPKNIGMSEEEIQRSIHNMTSLFGLEKYLSETPSILSAGIKRRLTIASLLVMMPKVLVLDEPTVGQDRKYANLTMEQIKWLNENKSLTSVVITHDMRIVAEFCRRVVVMNEGEIIFDGTPREVFVQNGLLKKTSLEPPQVTQLGLSLREFFNEPVLTVDEMVNKVFETKRK